jgi:hypothetical protein
MPDDFTHQARVMPLKRVGKGMGHVSQRKKKLFHDSHVLKKQFHGKLDSNKIIKLDSNKII